MLVRCGEEQATTQSQSSTPEKIRFVNPKWKDTLYVTLLRDSVQRTSGYLLGGDTFLVDSNSRIDSAAQYIRNASVQAFIETFCDTANEKPIYPAPVKREEIDLLVCNETFLNDQYQWLMIDSEYTVAPICFQEIHLNNDRKKELVIEIIRDRHWEHFYMIYHNDGERYTLAGTVSAINRNFWPAPIERIEKSDYWAVPSFGWGTGYTAIYHTYYKLISGIPIQMSEQITVGNSHWIYAMSDNEFSASTEIDSEVSFSNDNKLNITYSYTLKFSGDSAEYIIINKAHYRTIYQLSKTKNRYETTDLYITRGETDEDPEIELTPVFVDQIESLKKKGMPLQRRMLKEFHKANWLIENKTNNATKSSTSN